MPRDPDVAPRQDDGKPRYPLDRPFLKLHEDDDDDDDDVALLALDPIFNEKLRKTNAFRDTQWGEGQDPEIKMRFFF